MYYKPNIVKCKALIVCTLSVAIMFVSMVYTYAYDRVYVYTSASFGMETSLFSGTVLASLKDVKRTYVLDVSPRNPSYSKFVVIDYTSLSDLVYYCNEHGLNTTLAYNNAIGKYLAFVQDYEFSIGSFSNINVVGCLGNSDGSVYVAEPPSESGGVSLDTSGIIQMLMTIQSAIAGVDNSLGTIISRLSSFSADAINRLWNIDQTLAEIYYYGNIHLQQLNDRVQSAGDHLGIIESYLQIYFADMAADIHTTALESTRIRSAAESIEDYALNISTYTAGAYNGVNTIADLIVGWPEKFDQMNDYLRGIGSNSSDIYLTNKSILSAVDSIKTNTAAILSKLNNLTVSATSDYDDTTLLNRLDAISSAMQMFGGRLSSISQNTGALLDLFSLGETKTVEVKSGEYTFFDYSELGNIQSVRVSGNDDSGFVLFGVGGNTMDFVTTIAECNDGDISYPDYFWTVNVPTDTLTITVPSVIGLGLLVSRVPAGTYTVSLLDPSGSLISLAAGDKLRPSSTMGRWEVLRTDGGVVSIASCVGLPDGCDFADISPRCARVLVRDLVLAPSLLTSYSDAISYDAFSGYVGSYFQLINTSGESLTVEYVTPSPLLNWYANRQDDFRYWLDTRLNNLPASKAADLTAVTSRLDTIISALQEAPGDAACDHIYQQEATTDATCTLPGLMVSTCSNCGDSYSEIVDPLGHDWQCTDHVAAATDPDTGEETAAAYDIYTCSRCGDTYNDYSGDGAPEDYSNTSISRLIVELFSRLGKLAGSLMGFVLNVFDKALTGVDNIITKFNSYTEQITGFGGAYPAWLGGLWGILPTELQVALTFAVVCMAVALVGKKLVFS